MKKVIMLIALSLFLLSSGAPAQTEEDAYQKGLMLYKKHDYKAAIAHLKSYTETNPDPRAYYLIGYASYKIKDYTAAKKYFQDVYLIDPEFQVSSVDVR